MKEKAAYMLTAVRNGYRDLDSIRDAYNRFDDAGHIEFKPTLGIGLGTKNDAPMITAKADVAPVKLRAMMPNNYYNISNSKAINDSFSLNKNYNEGNVVKERLSTMYGNQADADSKLKFMQRLDKGYANNPASHLFVNLKRGSLVDTQGHRIFMDTRIPWSNTLNGLYSTFGHEMQHDYFPDASLEMSKFSPEYLQHFNGFASGDAGLLKSKMINAGMLEAVGTSPELEWQHDNRLSERLPFIKEVQKDMGKAINPATGKPYWDYTSGNPLDPEIYKEYKKNNPKARTQYWNDDDATWLLNNTASINNGPANSSLFNSDIPIVNPQEDYVTYAAYGGGLSSPFSHSVIPAVRYANGGNSSKKYK